MGLIELHVGGLGGLHHELYYPDTDNLFIDCLPESDNTALLSANALFWGQHFQSERVLTLAKTLAQCSNGLNSWPPAYRAIAANPELFVLQVEEAVLYLCDQGIGMRRFYRYVETLAILCQLYSDLEYAPHLLTLYEGFTSFELSSLALYDNCLTPSVNPYLDFIRTYCLPVVATVKPDLIWLNGRVSLAGIALARLAREILPDVHIAVVGHSSEYYSLNKITKYLARNKPLFSMIDSIVLDDAEQSRLALIGALKEGKKLSVVPNLLYADRTSGDLTIKQTFFQRHTVRLPLSDATRRRPGTSRVTAELDPTALVNIKFFPDHACYWNKCTFCGINKKYHGSMMEEAEWNVAASVEACDILAAEGVRYIWAIDEAIPPNILRALAEGLLDKGVTVVWQARSRFDPEFLADQTCELLAASGLKEIRFGLESASPRILKIMKKFPEGVNLATIREIVRRFDVHGISVHCPVIVGYPTETADDRQCTYNFLAELSEKYSGFSFNINLFSLDVHSPLCMQWDEHGITSVKFPCTPDHFLGNLLDWEPVDASPLDRKKLEVERNRVMRRHLYPWLPPTSITPPHILYRLCETIRSTLTFKATTIEEEPVTLPISTELPLCLPEQVTLAAPPQFRSGLWQLYNWENHAMADISPDIARILKNKFLGREKHITGLDQPSPGVLKEKDIQQLFARGFLARAR